MKTQIKIALLIFINLFALNLFAQEQNEMKEIQNVVKDLKTRFAPDSRTAVFNVNIEKLGGKFLLKGETNIPEAKDELMQKIKRTDVIDSIKILPDSKLGDKIYGIINLSVANLRTKPGHRWEMATQALLGTPVKVLKKKGGWFLVQTPDKYIAWLDDGGLYTVNIDSLSAWNSSDRIIITKDFGFAYVSPDENAARVSDLVIGDILKYDGKENGFCRVTYPDGRTGFVRAENCKPLKEWLSEADPTVDNILKTARSFMGIPYLWGGTSVKGMDCSGFTKTTFFLNGIVLPRDASQQYEIGNPVNIDDKLKNLKPGDLLFFGKRGDGNAKPKVTHVAIYIGNGDYINSAGRVKIDSFSKDKPNYSAYRDSSFVGAKRVLNSINAKGVYTITKNDFYNLKKK